jgi:hypothetical protein
MHTTYFMQVNILGTKGGGNVIGVESAKLGITLPGYRHVEIGNGIGEHHRIGKD